MHDLNAKPILFVAILTGLMIVYPARAQTASPERLDEIAERGSHVMPFDLGQTQHIFTKTETGGVQQVIARDAGNTRQIALIRQHLSKISQEFIHGDFSNPAKIHGREMPGLAELRNAKQGQLQVQYKELANGGEIAYSSDVQALRTAIHHWFDAQLADHGSDAIPGLHHGAMQHRHKQ